MMAAISKDVVKAAREATKAWSLLGSYNELVGDVARAILAERKRCAEVARKCWHDPESEIAADYIADRIESGQ